MCTLLYSWDQLYLPGGQVARETCLPCTRTHLHQANGQGFCHTLYVGRYALLTEVISREVLLAIQGLKCLNHFSFFVSSGAFHVHSIHYSVYLVVAQFLSEYWIEFGTGCILFK